MNRCDNCCRKRISELGRMKKDGAKFDFKHLAGIILGQNTRWILSGKSSCQFCIPKNTEEEKRAVRAINAF
jgi:hypothetical protein